MIAELRNFSIKQSMPWIVAHDLLRSARDGLAILQRGAEKNLLCAGYLIVSVEPFRCALNNVTYRSRTLISMSGVMTLDHF